MPWLRIRGFHFGFFSGEPSGEPPHIHVTGKGADAKLWLDPVQVVFSGYTRSETSDIVEVVNDRREQFLEMWHEHFRGR